MTAPSSVPAAEGRSGLGEHGPTVIPAPGNAFSPNMLAVDTLSDDWRGDLRRRHRRRAYAARQRGNHSTADHYLARARSLRERYVPRAQRCGTEVLGSAELGCSRCGLIRGVPLACGLWRWCEECGKRRRGGWYKRASRGLGGALRRAREAWNRRGRPRGERPDVTLVTLTCRHSGSIAADRHTIRKGWERLRAWLYQRDGCALPFVMVWELTPGTDGLGHIHAHVVAVWPWRDLRALDAEWQRATHGHGMTVDVSGSGKLRRGGHAPQHAASYAASYVGKGGIDRDCSAELHSEWLRIHANGARAYTSSKALLTAIPPESSPCCRGKEFLVSLQRGSGRGHHRHGGGCGYTCGSARDGPSGGADTGDPSRGGP